MKTVYRSYPLCISTARLWLVLSLTFTAFAAMAQQDSRLFWTNVEEATLRVQGERTQVPDAFRLVALNVAGLKQVLATAPLERTAAAPLELLMPMPDGSNARFLISESPVYEPGFAAKFPEIKTYSGQGADDPNATIRFSITPLGFSAIIITPTDNIFIDKYSSGDTQHYIVFYQRDLRKPAGYVDTEEGFIGNEELREQLQELIKNNPDAMRFSGNNLRTYRLAVAATGEYYAQFGTVPLTQAAIVAVINQVSAIYEREVAIRLALIADNDDITYTDATTDPYSNTAGSPCSTPINGENQTAIDGVIGAADYDIGHVFTGTNIGGCASIGAVCQANKARGTSGVTGGGAFDVGLTAHEMGHQFGADHTFNSNIGSCSGGQYSASTAYEPGSGSTIMSYAASCHSIQGFRDMMFHTISYDQIIAYSTLGSGNSCPVTTPTGNAVPTVNAGSGGFAIPIGTPFILTGSGADADGDPLTFSWEQFDLGPTGDPDLPAGNAPIFRAFAPVNSPSRTFPRWSDILSNTQTIGEILPGYGRGLTFRLTARDNRTNGGGVDHDQISFNVEGGAGPFLVTSPNTNVTWGANSMQTVTWNVANTTAAPVNTANVNILLSTDGGLTWPTTLLSNTPNDGSQSVLIPNTPVQNLARIMVAASGNVYFDVSNRNFSICTPPGIAVQPTDQESEFGLGATFSVTPTGSPAPSAQWQVKPAGAVSFTNIPGAQSNTLNLTNLTLADNGNEYRVVLTNFCGNITSDAAELTVTPRQTVTTLTIDPNPQQYSDLVDLSVSLSPGLVLGQSPATHVTFYIGTQLIGTVPLTVVAGDMVASIDNVALLEPTPFGTPPTGQMAPGTQDVHAVFSGLNPNFIVNDGLEELEIEPEDARTYFTGACGASTKAGNSNEATVTLSATFKDISAVPGDPDYDANPGDLRNATISFIDRATNTIIASNVPFGLLDPNNPTSAVATYNWVVNIAGNSQTFTIGTIIGGYYTRDDAADDVQITVSKPIAGNMTTGGGYLLISSSGGVKAADPGSNNNYGFTAKFNGPKLQLNGNFNTIVRRTESGMLREFQIKSVDMTSIAIMPDGSGGEACFHAKASIADVTDPQNPIMLDDNASLQVQLTDNGSPGTNDLLAITLWKKAGGLWYSSHWDGTTTQEQAILGGNLKVQGTATLRNAATTAHLWIVPNPSTGIFTVNYELDAEGPSELVVTDVTGRQVFRQELTGTAGINQQQLELNQLPKGLYLFNLTRNSGSETVRIVLQ